MAHPPDDVLLLYAAYSDSRGERANVEGHLQTCAPCRDKLATMMEQLKPHHQPAPALVDQLKQFEERLAKEEKTAEPIVAKLLEKHDWGSAAGRPELRTAGGIRVMLQVIPDIRRRSPCDALALSELGLNLSEQIRESSYGQEILTYVRGMLWREQANTLRVLGRFREALTALDYAEDQFAKNAAAEFELAGVWYVRAAVLREIDDLDQALLWISEAAEAYRRFGDIRTQNRAQYLYGAILFRQSRFAEARKIFSDLLPSTEQDGDEQTSAAIHSVLGQCEVELNEFANAESHLLEAVHRFELLGYELDTLRAKWALARLLAATGRLPQAIDTFRRLQEAFCDRKLNDEVALIGLDLAEALLSTDHTDEAAAVCGSVLELLRAADSPVNVIRAVEYLREATARRRATHSTAREVRRFVEGAARRPYQVFQPPPE